MRILDVGCGINKKPGSIGLDRNPASRADVLADLDSFPYPFRDSSFDALQAVHVIEHVSDVIRSMEEFHRLVRAGGEVGRGDDLAGGEELPLSGATDRDREDAGVRRIGAVAPSSANCQ